MLSLSSPSSTSHRPRRTAASRLLSPVMLGVFVGGLFLLNSGCSDAQIDASFQKIIKPRRSPQQWMIIAVTDDDPDHRREATAKVAESKKFDQEWAIKGFMTIALLESDPQTRCVAVRALGQTDDRRAAETCLKILNFEKHPPAEVRPPDDICRWDATEVLANHAERSIPDDLRDEMLETFLDRLSGDPSRFARLAAARGLKNFQNLKSIYGLIDGLRDEDFAVAYECEDSLAWLTGVTHECDPFRWEQWVEEHQSDAFANAGTLPEGRKPPYSGRWGKAAYETKQWMRIIVPASKE